jgi:hypothetical protein
LDHFEAEFERSALEVGPHFDGQGRFVSVEYAVSMLQEVADREERRRQVADVHRPGAKSFPAIRDLCADFVFRRLVGL